MIQVSDTMHRYIDDSKAYKVQFFPFKTQHSETLFPKPIDDSKAYKYQFYMTLFSFVILKHYFP